MLLQSWYEYQPCAVTAYASLSPVYCANPYAHAYAPAPELSVVAMEYVFLVADDLEYNNMRGI